MAIQTITLDPASGPMTGDAIVAAINAGSTAISRANAVSAAARPIAALEVTTAMLAANAVDNTKLATGVAKTNLDAMAATAVGYVKTSPTTGQFKVTTIQRDATGKLAVGYDDVAV